MLKDLAARWLCKDDVLKNHVGRAFLPASYLATTNGRPTIPFNTQSHVGRASCPPLDPGDHEWSPYNRIKASCPSRAGIPARLDPGDQEWSPYLPVQASSPCIPARLSTPATTNGRPTKENPPDEQSLSSEGFLN